MNRAAQLAALVLLGACTTPPRIPVIVDPPLDAELVEEAEDDELSATDLPAKPPQLSAPLTLPPQQVGPPARASALAAEGFESLGERRGVKVYRRTQREGIELAAEGVLAGPPERVLRVLTDYPGHKRWQTHLEDVRILGRGDNFLDVYERLNLPVVSDRDFVLRVTWGSEGDLRWMRFVAATAGGPSRVDGVVRVTAHSGSWRLSPAGTKTSAVYRFHLDLAGSFPSWLGASGATDELPALFENIDRELPRYP